MRRLLRSNLALLKPFCLSAFVILLVAATVLVAESVSDQPIDVGGVSGGDSTRGLAGSPYQLTNHVRVPAGTMLTFDPRVVVEGDRDWSLEIDGTLRTGGTPAQPITFHKTAANTDAAQIEAAIYDSAGASDSPSGGTADLVVVGAGPPRPTPQKHNLGTYSIGEIEIPLAATGGDGMNYAWEFVPGLGSLPPGVSLRTDGPSWFASNQQAGLIGVATVPAMYSFRLQVTSGGQTAFQDYTLTISSLVVKDLYQLPDAFAGEPYSYTLTALRSGAPVSATWMPINGFTPGITLSSGGELSGTPAVADAGSNNLWFSVTEGGETVYRGVRVDVYAVDITTPGSSPNVTKGVSHGAFDTGPGLSYRVAATDSPLPHLYDSKSMSIDVDGVPPELRNVAPYGNVFDDCTLGVSCSRGVAVRSGGKGPFTWTATGLPGGMSIRSGGGITTPQISPGDAEIWGTPTELGTFDVMVTVTDFDGASATNTLTLHVSALLLTSYLRNGTLSVPYPEQTLRVLGGFGTYAATLVRGRFPLNIALDPTTLKVNGTPMENGYFNVTFHVADTDPVGPNTLDTSNGFFINASGVTINNCGDLGTVTPGSNYAQQLAACCPSCKPPSSAGRSGVPLTKYRAAASVDRGPTRRGTKAEDLLQTLPANASGLKKNQPVGMATASPNPAEATGPGGAMAVLDGTGSSDPHGDSLTYSWREGSIPIGIGRTLSVQVPIGSHPITLTVADGHHRSASSDVTVVVRDTTAPELSGVPGELALEATGPAGAQAWWMDPAALDVVDGAVPVACVPASGSIVPIGATVVTCSATDAHGNVGTASFDVMVQDTMPPVFSGVPTAMTREATSAAGAIVPWPLPMAADSVDGPVVVVCTPASGMQFAHGQTSVTCVASDSRGHRASAGFTVQVVDTTGPALTLPTPVIAEATTPLGAAARFEASATDLVSGTAVVECAPASGSGFAPGTTIVSCSATDAAGNVSTGAFPVTVRDTTPPVVQFTSPSPRALLATSPATVTVLATDVLGVSNVTVNGAAAALTNGTPQAGTWTATVPVTVGPDTAISFSAVAHDAAGNATQAMLVVDNDGIPAYALYEPRSHTAPVSVDVDASGAMKVSQGETSFIVRSYFSRPNGGMLYLGNPPGGANNERWNVTVLGGGNQYMVTGSTAAYSLTRTITVHPNRIEVSDAFRNLSTETTGVRFGNEIVAPDAVTALVAGAPAAQSGSKLNVPERPFVQVMKAGFSLGVVARDDAYRNQSVSYYTPADGSYGVKDDNFGLRGGGSYTTRWELYPTDSSDPFDFYNAVRAEWGTDNATIPGLFAFIYPQRKWMKNGKTLAQMTVQEMKDWLDTTGIQTVCFAVKDDLDGQNIEAFGSRYLVSEASKAYWRPIIQRLRQAKPDLKAAPYFHLGADVPNDPEVTSSRMILLSGLQKVFTNSRGITRWYYYPATASAFALRMRRVFEAIFADFPTDAFYWDEYSYGNKSEYLDGGEWDGISVVINPTTNRVSKQVTLTSMATRNLREQWTKELMDRGLTVWTNWQPTTELDTARNQPHFLEHFSSGGSVARGYLASPIQLDADSSPSSNADVLAAIHRFLEAGLLYAHIGASAYAEVSPSILKHFYPMTPKELHAGYVLGRERIVTGVTGAFGFGDSRTLTASIYDQAGRLKDDAGRAVMANGRMYQLVVLAANEVAVIEPAPTRVP